MSSIQERLRSEKYAKRSFPICARGSMLKAADLIERLAANQIPEGHVAMPREPTSEMLREGYEAAAPLQEIKRAPQVLMFKAMLTAAEGGGK